MIWRYLLATILSILVIIAFQSFGRRPPPRRPRGDDEVARVVDRGEERAEGAVVGAPEKQVELPVRLEWSEDGELESLKVAVPRPGQPGELEVRELLRAAPGAPAPLALAMRAPASEGAWGPGDRGRLVQGWEATTGTDASSTRRWVHEAVLEDPRIRVERTVILARVPEDGLSRKGYVPRHLVVRLHFENLGAEDLEMQYELHGASGMRTEREETPQSDIRLAYGILKDGRIASSSARLSSLGDSGWQGAGAAWVGAYNSRFLAALYPRGTTGRAADTIESAGAWRVSVDESGGRRLGLRTALRSKRVQLKAGESFENEYGFFTGPRDPETLDAYSAHHLAESNRVDVRFPRGRYGARVDTGNGSLVLLSLVDFDRKVGGEPGERQDYDLLGKPLRGHALFSVELMEQKEDGGQPSSLGLGSSPWILVGDEADGRIVLESTVGDIRVTKRIEVAPSDDVVTGSKDVLEEAAKDPKGPYHLNFTVEIENLADRERMISYRVYGPSAIDTEDRRTPGQDFVFASAARGGSGQLIVTEMDAGDMPERGWESPRQVAWVGLKNSYFATILFPRPAADGGKAAFVDIGFASTFPDPESVRGLAEAEASKTGRSVDRLIKEKYLTYAEQAYKNFRVGFSSIQQSFAPGQARRHEYGLFAAPRLQEAFSRYDRLDFEGINGYGFMGTLVGFFISFLNALNVLAFGSWGLAIVLLTFFVKLCLHPINRRSQRSIMRAQKKMQKVKPLMDEIKERHGKDRLAMQREMQKLFQEHGINPAQQLGGCLMIFLQLPIWIGLLRTLQFAIGLRQAEFLYIGDLTKPDALFPLGITLPWLGSHFNLLPVLYVILTLFNQKLQPKPADPQMQSQYKMMTFMLVFFGFIFYKFPSGFMLYIMTSAALGIVESKIIKSQLKKEEEAAEPAAATPALAAAYPVKPREKSSAGAAAAAAKRKKRRRKGRR